MRIISICPSNTELAAYLGLTEQLVAVDDYSDWPEEIQSLPRVGKDLDINMEQVEALEPDLVLASLSVPGMEKNIEELNRRNLPYLILNPSSLEEIGNDLLTVGEHTGCFEHAKAVKEQYDKRIEMYRTKAEQITAPPTLYWEWWPKPVFTPGGTNWLTEISELAGGRNLFADQTIDSVQSTWEDVYERNPDHICLAWVGVQLDKVQPKLVRKRPNWEELKAVQENRLHVLEEPLYCRPSPRLLVGLQRLAHLLHPETFPDYGLTDPLLNKTSAIK